MGKGNRFSPSMNEKLKKRKSSGYPGDGGKVAQPPMRNILPKKTNQPMSSVGGSNNRSWRQRAKGGIGGSLRDKKIYRRNMPR